MTCLAHDQGYLTAGLAAVAFSLALAGACEAQGVMGRYTYVEPGYEGTMAISQMGPGFVFKFKTKSKSNGQMCDFQTYETSRLDNCKLCRDRLQQAQPRH